MINEDYSEKVIEILCEKIDDLEKQIKELKNKPPVWVDGNVTYLDSCWTTPSVTHSILCHKCGSYPCRCLPDGTYNFK